MKKWTVSFLIFLMVLSGCTTKPSKSNGTNTLQPAEVSTEEQALVSLLASGDGLLLRVHQEEDFTTFESNLYVLKDGRWETLYGSASTLSEKITHIYIELDMEYQRYVIRYLEEGALQAEGSMVELSDVVDVSEKKNFVMTQMVESQNFNFEDGEEVCVFLCGYSNQDSISVGLSDFEHPEAIDTEQITFAVTIKFSSEELQ